MNFTDPQSTPDDALQSDNSTVFIQSKADDPLIYMEDETGTVRIPIIEEQLQIQKQLVETGRVRLVKTVEEQTELVRTPYQQEHITVERVPVDRYVSEAPPTRQEGDTTIYSVLKEVVVVEKRLLLVEEIHVKRSQLEAMDEQNVSLRREQITVERDNLSNERSV